MAFILLEPSKGASHGSRFTFVANWHPHSNHSSDLAIRRTARLSVTKRCDAWQARPLRTFNCGKAVFQLSSCSTDSWRYFPRAFMPAFNIAGVLCLAGPIAIFLSRDFEQVALIVE